MKSRLNQTYRRIKYRKNNVVAKNVFFTKDIHIEGNSYIRADTSIGPEVSLGKNVRIAENVKLSYIKIGENSEIDYGVICTGYGNGKISLGKESYVGIRNILDRSDNINIGDFVHIAGPSTALWTHTSVKMCLESKLLNQKNEADYRPTSEITIENNVYIGGNCTIYPGVTIGHHSIIAPNSAVAKDVPPNSMYGGVPAKLVKSLDIEAMR